MKGIFAMTVALLLVGGVVFVASGTSEGPTGDEHVGIHKGINLGNALEAPREGAWGVVLREEYFRLIRDAGFDFVRVPIRWSAHAEPTAPYTIDERFVRRVDWVVQHARKYGLSVILDMHHYESMITEPEEHLPRFLALWQQIADHYSDQPASVYFELLNEPHGELTADRWNRYLREALKVIRKSNPDRWVVVGPVQWNSVHRLYQLDLPEDDRRLLVTFHYYLPFEFTHQGAEWVQGSNRWLGRKWRGSYRERWEIERDLDRASRWAEENNRPVFLGEFGAYSKADMNSRARWTNFICRQAEKRGIPWCYWEFCSGFGVYDALAKRWREPLLEALLPDSPLLGPK